MSAANHTRRKSDDRVEFTRDIGDEADSGNPLVHLMYEFLTVPTSSKVAYTWSILACWMVVIRLLEIGLESCDGPNQYDNRSVDRSRYKFLLTDDQYWTVYVACMVPLIIDALGRVITLCFVIFGDENADLYAILKQDKLEIFLFASDVVGVIPFFIQAVYIRSKEIELSQAQTLVLTLIELLITSHIMRVLKDIPAIRVIRITIYKSAHQLLIPLFFFLMFNITAGVFLYFAEPCYDVTDCPWVDLFQATYFSMVTMTTVGFGTQIPDYELGRLVACVVMMFGVLFLAMPLAIIGNEYDKAWFAIGEEGVIRAQMRAQEEIENREALLRRKMPLSTKLNERGGYDNTNGDDDDSDSDGSKSDGDDNDDNRGDTNAAPSLSATTTASGTMSDSMRDLLAKEEQDRVRQEKAQLAVQQSSVMTTRSTLLNTLNRVKGECKANTRVTPKLLLQYCELRAWLPVLSHHINYIFDTLVHEKERRIAAARPMVQSTGMGFLNSMHNNQQQQQLQQQQNATSGDGSGGTTTVATKASMGRRLSMFNEARRKASLVAPPTLPSEMASSNNSNKVAPAPSGLGSNKPKKKTGHDNDEGSDDDDDDEDDQSTVEGKQRNASKQQKLAQLRAAIAANKLAKANEKGSETRDGEEIHSEADLPKHLRPRQSLFQQETASVFAPSQNSNGCYAKMLRLIGVDDWEAVRYRSMNDDFVARMESVSQDPDCLRSRIWVLLEIPDSSYEATALKWVIIALILISIFLLYTETVTRLTPYGESTAICGKVLHRYCSDKFNSTLDPGCYQQTVNGTLSEYKLQFSCHTSECFGHGNNFGAVNSNMTCDYSRTDFTTSGVTWQPPFQDEEQLLYRYGLPYIFTPRAQMHQMSPVCTRIECSDNSLLYSSANLLWIAAEFVINLVFTIELILRVVAAENLLFFLKDGLNIMDLIAIIPFYIVLFSKVGSSTVTDMDFSILASSPEPMFLVTIRAVKLFRMFKLFRHFEASKVLTQTAALIWRQVLGMFTLLFFLVVLFAIFLFIVEGGTVCYVGDPGCYPPDNMLYIVRNGDRILLNNRGEMSRFENVFQGIWFAFSAFTTTGFGDAAPVTNIGQVLTIILVLFGVFYLAMPLTAVASTFYQVHETYWREQESIRLEMLAAKKANSKSVAPEPAATTAVAAAPLGTIKENDEDEEDKEDEERDTVVNRRGSASKGVGSSGGDNSDNPLSLEELLTDELRATVRSLIAELFVSSSTIDDTFREMQAPSAPVPEGGTVTQSSIRTQSVLMKSIVRQTGALERFLLGSEADLRSLVTIYNEYMRYNPNHGHAQQVAQIGSG